MEQEDWWNRSPIWAFYGPLLKLPPNGGENIMENSPRLPSSLHIIQTKSWPQTGAKPPLRVFTGYDKSFCSPVMKKDIVEYDSVLGQQFI